MPKDFGYINARIRGMKSKLLGPEFFDSALDATDFPAFLSVLSSSSYMRDIEESQSRFEGLKIVDDALGRNFYKTARSMLDFSDGNPGELILALLMRYDLNNIKAIARAKHAGRDESEIMDKLLPAGQLKPAVLETLASAGDMAAVAQALTMTKTPLRKAFNKAYAKYASDNDLYAMELELDREHYRAISQTLKTAKPTAKFKRFMQLEIDATNLRTALSTRGQDIDSNELFVRGGREIKKAMFDDIVNDTSAVALQGLTGTSFADVAETTDFNSAESVIRSVLEDTSSRLRFDGMNIGLVASYLRTKESEVAKLRLLARGKFYGVPKDTLAKELGHA